MSLLAWILWGLFVGAIARVIVPGRQRIGLVRTILLGVAGSLVGGIVATQAFHVDTIGSFGLGSFAIAVGASALLLVAYERLEAYRQRHPRTP